MPYLFILFVVMPIAEIAVLIQVGGAIGGWTTIGIVILTAIIGTAMLRQQGIATLNKAQLRMQNGEMPAQQMLEGMLLLIGGVLLLTPGFITDFFGFLTLIPVSRRYLAAKLSAGALSNMNIFVGGSQVTGRDGVHGRSHQSPNGMPGSRNGADSDVRSRRHRQNGAAGGDPDVIEGDYDRLD